VIKESLKKFVICILTIILCCSSMLYSFACEPFDGDDTSDDTIDYVQNIFETNQKKLEFSHEELKKIFVSLYNDAVKYNVQNFAKLRGQKNASSSFFADDYIVVTSYVLENLHDLMSNDFVYNVLEIIVIIGQKNKIDVLLDFSNVGDEKIKENLVNWYNEFNEGEKDIESDFYASDFYSVLRSLYSSEYSKCCSYLCSVGKVMSPHCHIVCFDDKA